MKNDGPEDKFAIFRQLNANLLSLQAKKRKHGDGCRCGECSKIADEIKVVTRKIDRCTAALGAVVHND